MPVAAIALGSNLASTLASDLEPYPLRDAPPPDQRAVNLRRAIDLIAVLGTIAAVSRFYDTAPVGYLDQPRFLNAALLLETTLPPLSLLDRLLDIERTLGRDRSASAIAKGPRVIDLDLLLFGDLVLTTPALILPHPAMRDRRFVLEPLAEIAPQLIDPISGNTIATLLTILPTDRQIS